MRILIFIGCIAVASTAWAGSSSSSFRVGLTVVRSPQQVGVSVARQHDRLQTISRKCSQQGDYTTQVDDWVVDHTGNRVESVNIDCTIESDGGQLVVVQF